MNTTTITGHLVQEPELRFVASGQPVASFFVADNRRWQHRTTAEWQETSFYFDVVGWADLAENVATSLKRGSRVTVIGPPRATQLGELRRRQALQGRDPRPRRLRQPPLRHCRDHQGQPGRP
jgi:hypothetical protein